MTQKYELIVLGGGAAAFAASIKANEFGVKTAMVNYGNLGGTCVNVGCVPSKHLITTAEEFYYPQFHAHEGLKHGKGKANFKKIIENKNKLVSMLRKVKYTDVVNGLPNVTFYDGMATFISKNEIKVGDKTLTGGKFIIATGAVTYIPPIEGIEKVEYLTNVTAMQLKKIPKSMLIIGGGPLGLEFAQMFAHFGTKVMVFQKAESVLNREEPEISEFMKKHLESEGIKIYTNAEVKSVKKSGTMKVLTSIVNGKKMVCKCEHLLLAAGRTPNTKELSPEIAGVELNKRGYVIVDNDMHTSASHVWAAGDVKGEPMLETIAAKEGNFAAVNAIKGEHKKIDYFSLPHAVFTTPQVAGVGLTDAEAVKKGFSCNCAVLPMSMVPKAIITGKTEGLIKMVIDRKTKRILGVHIASHLAADMIHEAALAVKFKLTINDIIDTVHVFPTMSESIKMAAQSFGKDLKKLSCCVE